MSTAPAKVPSARWRVLVLVALAQVGAMSTWFAAAAAAPALVVEWSLTPPDVGWLTVATQVGFVVGALLAALSGVADVLSARRVFIVAAISAALVNALFVVGEGNWAWALLMRFALGFALAGVYPVGMKLMAGWFRDRRGLAIGVIVGALTLGTASPHFVAGIGLGGTDWRWIVAVTSLGAVVAAVIVAGGVSDGPYDVRANRLDLRWAVGALRAPAMRLANVGYLGHMWELYAMWTWLPAILAASFVAHGMWPADAAPLAAATAIAAGALGCVAGGLAGDRYGRTLTTAVAMLVSGASAIVLAGLFGAAPVLVVGVALIWGISVIADSAQFSAAVSELAPADRVASALALQTALGFLLTVVSIQAVPLVTVEWGYGAALAMLAIGPAVGVIAMLRLRRRPESAALAGGRR